MSGKQKVCKNCKNVMPSNAKICPVCGAKYKTAFYKKWWFWVLVVFLVIGLASGGETDITSTDNPTNTPSSSEVTNDDVNDVGSADVENESQENDSVPKEYKSALKKAETYSEMMHMSKAGIYAQLVSEYGEAFSEEAAQYAMDNIVADWNQNALKSAESYAKTMHMSKAAIYDQLVSEAGEGFTDEEAQYAIDNVSADWNANALASAKTYQDMMDMSPNAIYNQLTSEYGDQFTPEEAQYAIDNLE